jgi:predicted DCC family thiol-disulfide oxidoreductase YuxK
MRLLRRLDWFVCFSPVPVTQSFDPSLPEALRGKDLQAALHVLTADGRVYSGAEAFRFMGLRLPLVTLPALALFLPGMLPLAAMIYRWVSSHRHPISHWLDAIHGRDL